MFLAEDLVNELLQHLPKKPFLQALFRNVTLFVEFISG